MNNNNNIANNNNNHNGNEVKKNIKCLVLGNKQVGKTRLIEVYEHGHFLSRDYCPSKTDDFTRTVTHLGVEFQLTICDSFSDSFDYDIPPRNAYEATARERFNLYHLADVVLLCFSVVNFASFRNIKTKWTKTLQEKIPNQKLMEIPILLVATQIDLRDDENTIYLLEKNEKRLPISKNEGEVLAKEIGALKYVECSSFRSIGVKEVFDEVVQSFLATQKLDSHQQLTPKKTCLVM